MGLIFGWYLQKVNSLIHFFLVFFSRAKTRMGCGVSRIREGASEGAATGSSVDGERPGPARWCGRVRRNQGSGRKGRRAGLDAGFFRRPASYRSPSSVPSESSGNVGEKKSGIDWREGDEVLQRIRRPASKSPAESSKRSLEITFQTPASGGSEKRSFSRTATRRKPGLLWTEFFVVERRRRE